jgi:ABC-type transport system substrate-binding protein
MWYRISLGTKQWLTSISLAMVLLVACGTATAPADTPGPVAVVTPTDSPGPAVTVTQTQPVATPSAQPSLQPDRPQTAKDRAVAVISVEPEHLSIRNIDAHGGQLLDTVSGYMGHVDRDTRQVSPSSLIRAWRQTGPDQWEYDLRPDVTFHDGASWDVAAWQEYARVAGVPDFPLTSYAITGP